MVGLTLAQAQERLDGWLAVDMALAGGQTVRDSDGKMLTRADAGTVRENIDYWQKKCQELQASSLSGGRGRSRVVSPSW